MARTRLGWLGPAIVLVGAAVAVVGIVYMVRAKPVAGAQIDSIKIDDRSHFVIRDESGGDRAFLELWDGDVLRWQALIPHYAGSPGRRGIAWSKTAVTIRVERGGRAEVFALSMHDSAKLRGFRLAPEHEPIHYGGLAPLTITDHQRSYELVGGSDWNQLVAVDLTTGVALWKAELGAHSVIDARVEGGIVIVDQLVQRQAFDAATGRVVPAPPPIHLNPNEIRDTYDRAITEGLLR